MEVVGQAIKRLDGLAKVTGQAQYTSDLWLPGMLHARLLRSTWPHARITIDSRAALAAPGVQAVLFCGNTTDRALTASDHDVMTEPWAVDRRDQRLFPVVARYVGEPIAAVAAETDVAAQDALALIEVEYEALPAVLDAAASGDPAGAALSFTLGEGPIDSDVVVEGRFETQRQKHAQLEPHGAVAFWRDGKLTVWSACQAAHLIKQKLADLFQLPEAAVQVINPAIGGAFGSGLGFNQEHYAAALTLATGRPVRLVLDRMEDFAGSESRHPMAMVVRLAASRDGQPVSLEVRTRADAGAYLTHSRDVLAAHGALLLRPYAFRSARFEGQAWKTNTPVNGGFRGYGGPQGFFALEQTVDEAAERLGIDPVELRLRWCPKPGATDPFSKLTIDSSGLYECLRRGREAIGWEEKRREPRGSGPRRRGVGVAAVMWTSGTSCVTPSVDTSLAEVRMGADGSATVASASPEIGTGAQTALLQIAAETLGLPLQALRFSATDTDVAPYDTGSHASRTVYVAGDAIQRACLDTLRQLRAIAAEMLEAAESDLAVGPAPATQHGPSHSPSPDAAEEGMLWVKGSSVRKVTYAEVVRRAYGSGRQIVGVGAAEPRNDPPFGAHFAEIEVEVETGCISVLQFVAAHDVGRAINPALVAGQIHGSVQQALGFALCEEMVVDGESGVTLTSSFADYAVLTANRMPQLEVILVESAGAKGPYGSKGIGEPAIVPAAAAVANALYHATGFRCRQLPLTPERVWRGLQAS